VAIGRTGISISYRSERANPESGELRDTHFNFIAIGDYIVASGTNDGTAIAVSPRDIAPEQGRLIVGRAWEASDEQGVKLINTVVGLPESASTTAALARTVRAQQEQRNELRKEKDSEIRALAGRLAKLESLVKELATTKGVTRLSLAK